MAPLVQSVGADEAMEIESDFQDWTLEMDVVNQRYGAAQAAEDTRLESTITAIENQIQADSDALFANLNSYMQQCLEKMQQEMKGAVSRQVQHHLQLEKMKVEHESRKQERARAKKKQIIDLFDKRRSTPNSRRKETSIGAPDYDQSTSPPHTNSSSPKITGNDHATKISNPISKVNGSLRSSEDGGGLAETTEVQNMKLSDHSTSATPVMGQGSRAPSAAASDIPADGGSTSTRDASKAPSVDPERMIDPLGIGAVKRKGDIFASGPADTAKRARVEQRKDTEPSPSVEANGSQTPQRPSPQIPVPAQRTISFDEVYQDGKAEHKHIIIEYMDVSGQFYILKCDEHHVHFGSNPLAGAAKHLSSSQHNKLPKTHELAIEKLGFYVTGCNRELADKNNARFHEAVKKGYEPFNANRLSKAEKIALGLEVADSPSHQQTGTKHKSPKEAGPAPSGGFGPDKHREHQFQGITDPVSGELYLGYWAKTKTKYPVIVLPLGDLKAAGLNGTLLQTSLQKNIPKCYKVTHPTPGTLAIEGWAKDYEDGGPKMTKREFPVMYFDKRYLVGWITARHLSEFDFEDPNSGAYPGYNAARDYWARIQDGGCMDYEDWKKRGRIRNPTLSPSDSKEASPASGSEKPTEQASNSTSQEPSLHPELPKTVSRQDDRADEEMVDAEDVDPDKAADEPLANTNLDASTEISDVEMAMGDEKSPKAAKSQGLNAKEQVYDEQASNAARRATSSGGDTRPTSLLNQAPPVEKLPVVPPSHILASQKPLEKMPQALSIPTPPLNSTEASPTATVSPAVTPSSLQTSFEKQTAEDFATKTIHVNSPNPTRTAVNGARQGQRDVISKILQAPEPPKSTNTPIQERSGVPSHQAINKTTNVQVNGNSQTGPPDSQKARISMTDSRQAKQPTPTPMVNSPGRSAVNGYEVGAPIPATSVPATREQPEAMSFARNAGLSQRGSRPSSPLTTGINVPASIRQSGSPTINNGVREAMRELTATTQPPPRPVGTSPRPAQYTYTSFMSATQRPQPIAAARSLSPAMPPYRSASSTPTPASEATSRHNTPTIIRGDNLDKWKAVRSSSHSQSQQPSFSFATLASGGDGARGQSAPQERRESNRGFSLSSIMTNPSTPGSGLMKPSPIEGGKEQYFDVVAYTDSTDSRRFVKDEHAPFLRVTVNPARGVAETAPGEAIAVSIDPKDVLRAVVRNAGMDVASVTLTLRRPDSRPEYWAFGPKNVSGRSVSGKIQARSFCKWITSANPNVEYISSGAGDDSRQSSVRRSPVVTLD